MHAAYKAYHYWIALVHLLAWPSPNLLNLDTEQNLDYFNWYWCHCISSFSTLYFQLLNLCYLSVSLQLSRNYLLPHFDPLHSNYHLHFVVVVNYYFWFHCRNDLLYCLAHYLNCFLYLLSYFLYLLLWKKYYH